MTQQMIDQAKAVMRKNDRGAYTVPTHGLYPFQWNWDSALSALGFSHFDEPRAWTEIETLFAHQWDDGMVPHIIFHQHDDGYFPGPDVWGTGRSVPTSGITQPPVAGFAARRIFDRAQDKALAAEKARALLPKIHAWHQWFFANRDPQGTGLVAIIHPWESGRDNSVDWDAAFERVPTEGVQPFTRRDTSHANPAHRPTDEQYKRYIWLVQKFRSLGWDNTKLHDASPFQIVDPGFNAILIRSCADLAELADALGETQIASQSRAMADKAVAAMETLWSDKLGQYVCHDRAFGATCGQPIDWRDSRRLCRDPKRQGQSHFRPDRGACPQLQLPCPEPRPHRARIRCPALLAWADLVDRELHDLRWIGDRGPNRHRRTDKCRLPASDREKRICRILRSDQCRTLRR